MFCFNTPIPFYKLKITSFFDEKYKTMKLSKRTKKFIKILAWERKKYYIIFLKTNGYINL